MVDRELSLDYASAMEAHLERGVALRESIFGEMQSIEECLDNYHTYKTSKLYSEVTFPQYLVAKESAKELLQTGMDLRRGVDGSAYGAGSGEQLVSSDNNVIGHKGDFLFERTRLADTPKSREKAEKLNELLAFSNAKKNIVASAGNDEKTEAAAKPVSRGAPRLMAAATLLSKVQALSIVDNDGADSADGEDN